MTSQAVLDYGFARRHGVLLLAGDGTRVGLREGADFVQEAALKLVRRGFDFDDVHARFLRERGRELTGFGQNTSVRPEVWRVYQEATVAPDAASALAREDLEPALQEMRRKLMEQQETEQKLEILEMRPDLVFIRVRI